MKASVFSEYGPPEVLRLEEVEKPLPKVNEILVKVHASPVNYGDITTRNFKAITPKKFNMPLLLLLPTRLAFGLRKPRVNILGSEFAGEVEDIGEEVTEFKKGDQVIGYLGMKMGANAEYLCIPASGTVGFKPESMSFEEAATLPYGGIMASSLLKKAFGETDWSGKQILINGASGGIGSMAVQLAKSYGAEVTGVCSSPRIEFVKSLGADRVIDYTKEDFTENGMQYDLIFDVLGKSSFSRCKKTLKPKGRYLLASFKTRPILQMLRTKVFGNKKVICGFAEETPETLKSIKELAETGKIKAIIDKSFPLEQTADAHRYVESGQKKGNVVVSI